MSTQCNLACVAKGNNKRCQLLNLVTGERFALPKKLSLEHRPLKLEFWNHKVSVSVAFGHVPATGEFKLLRVIDDNSTQQLCEVFTHGGSRGGARRWRGKKAAQDRVHMSPLSRVVMDGVVYFLLDEHVSRQKGIASFDLLTEEWRAVLGRPVSIQANSRYAANLLSLVALDGSLVLFHWKRHHAAYNVSMDMWSLMDFEKGLWVKQHDVEDLSVHDECLAHPLVILKNGSIVIYSGTRRALMIYDPRTNTCTDVAYMASRVPGDGIGLYTGNLLSMANDAA